MGTRSLAMGRSPELDGAELEQLLDHLRHVRRLLTDPSDEVGCGARILQTSVRQRLSDELHRGDRGAQLVRHVTDKVAPNSFKVMDARLVAHHQQSRHLAVESDRPSVEVPVVQGDRALLDTAALARGVEQPDDPVVDLAGDKIRSFGERQPEQTPGRLIGEQHSSLSVETHDARVKEEPHGPEHVDAP